MSSGQRLLNIGLAGKSPEQSAVEAAEGLHYAPYDESALLASRLQQHQISAGSSPAGKPMVLQLNHHHQQHQQQMLLQGMGRSPVAASGGDSGLLPLLLSLGSGGSADSRFLVDRSRDEVDHSFKSPDPTGEEGLYNAFGGSLQRAAQAATGSSRSRTLPCRFRPPTSTTPSAELAKPPATMSLSIRCSPASPPPGRTSATPAPEPRSRLHLVLGGPSTTKALLRFHPAPASCSP